MLTEIAAACVSAPVVLAGYAYAGYPALLSLIARRSRRPSAEPVADWPSVSVVVPVFNEARVIGATVEHLLALEYPRDRLQILVVSDCSDDGTDDIVRSFADRGVELLRVAERRGKTAAENAAGRAVRGDIVVNLDATIRVAPGALRALVAAFADPTVGVASGRDVTTGFAAAAVNRGEGQYTNYEMRVRAMESAVFSIVGASGCFFASRRELYRLPFPEHLSRDFGSALVARVHGFRSVAVDDAICFVPCAPSLHVERRRKMRTMTRGIGTLWHMRELLDPTRYGVFSWMLFSHKVCRWAVPLTAPLAAAGVVALAMLPGANPLTMMARVLAGAGVLFAGMAWTGWRLSAHGPTPAWLTMPAFAGASLTAGAQAWMQWLRGERKPVWEPTRRADQPTTATP